MRTPRLRPYAWGRLTSWQSLRGAVSLRFDDVAKLLIEKVRAAAGARLKTSLRLRERVRFRIGDSTRGLPQTSIKKAKQASKGEGLVLVGTSTGGPPALEALITGLPASFPWPIIVAQHMPATFTGPLARRLDGISQLVVQEVRDPVALKPGNVYIGRGRRRCHRLKARSGSCRDGRARPG
ncbi:MAG: chemotaxis protein CheB [Bradyrhizobium sp.]